ncbi:MAG: DNA polymerase III subunit gamma/tau [Erysipelotrichales bacterium]|nr:DNA polymerase III subunit gamma/tau [Erysipelotrichales bacterium]
MDYRVLYRKYRPTTFDDLVGQDHIKNILKNSIINNKIAHAYIFTGPRGTGKTSTAKIFSRTLNCINQNSGIPCGECNNCINFNTSPDVIEMDAASNNSVVDIREIVDNVAIAPTNSKYKIYIIDEVHMLSNQAWNALLKTLEEPPANVIFILATTEIQSVPITVLSRCQRFDFQRIDRSLIFDNLKKICDSENIKYDDASLTEISYLSEGCMRDALSILDQLSKVTDNISIDVLKSNFGTVTSEELDLLYTFIIKNDIDGLVLLLRKIKDTGIDIKVFLDKILDNFIDKAINMKKANISSAAFNQLKKIIESLNELYSKIGKNSNGYLLLELELITFINDEENQISNRDINQIISREIIGVDTKIDVNNMLNDNKNSQKYLISEEFIKVRINNTFVNCTKEFKVSFSEIWKDFINNLKSENIVDLLNIVSKAIPQVVSDKYVIFLTKSESIKILANSKLYELENKFLSNNGSDYKFVFISKNDWELFMKDYDKTKKYDILSEDEFIVSDANSVKLAEDVFGEEKVKID